MCLAAGIRESTFSDWRTKPAVPSDPARLLKAAVSLGGNREEWQARWRQAREAHERVLASRRGQQKPGSEDDPGAALPPGSSPGGRQGSREGTPAGQGTPADGISTGTGPRIRKTRPRRRGILAVIAVVVIGTAAAVFVLENRGAGQAAEPVPLAAKAVEQWDISDPVERVIPPGSGSGLKELLASGTTTAAQSTGIAVHTLKAHLVVQAMGTTVTITGITLVARRLSSISDGTLIYAGSQGAGKAIQLYFSADSADDPGKDSDGRGYFSDSYVTLAPGEATEFNLEVTADRYYSQFWFEITTFASGRVMTIPVKDDQLFRIAPANGRYNAVYTLPANSPDPRWVRESPQAFCRQNPGICAG